MDSCAVIKPVNRLRNCDKADGMVHTVAQERPPKLLTWTYACLGRHDELAGSSEISLN